MGVAVRARLARRLGGGAGGGGRPRTPCSARREMLVLVVPEPAASAASAGAGAGPGAAAAACRRAGLPQHDEGVRLDADDEARDEVEDARRGARGGAGVEVERHVEQTLERLEQQGGRVRELIEEEAERRGQDRRALGYAQRHLRGRPPPRLLLPRARLEDRRLEHLLHARVAEGGDALLVGEELQHQWDPQVGRRQVGKQQLGVTRRQRRAHVARLGLQRGGHLRERLAFGINRTLHVHQCLRLDGQHVILGLKLQARPAE